jgi:hypothetical protein
MKDRVGLAGFPDALRHGQPVGRGVWSAESLLAGKMAELRGGQPGGIQLPELGDLPCRPTWPGQVLACLGPALRIDRMPASIGDRNSSLEPSRSRFLPWPGRQVLTTFPTAVTRNS